MEQTLPVARRSHKKSRNGCAQCKQRKVKCDERKPLCVNCEKHFLNMNSCDFPEPDSTNSDAHVIPSRAPKRTKGLVRKLAPITSVSKFGSRLDPFNAGPSSEVPDAERFLHHYFSNFTTKTFPMVMGYESRTMPQIWWEIARGDPVLFHATLALSAFDLESLRGDKVALRPRILLNRECIRLLRERVEDPLLGSSDQTIGSVLFLAIIEFENGNTRVVRMHFDGLKRMVSIRGGIDSIRGTNPLLADMIYGISMTIMAEPLFSPSDSNLPHSAIIPITVTKPDFAELESLDVSPPHAQILRDMNYLCQELSRAWPCNPTQDYCSYYMNRLAFLPIPFEEGLAVAYISEACSIATILLCFLPFRNDYPNPSLMFNTQLHKLIRVIKLVLEVVEPGHLLLPWLLLSGGIYAVEPERSWFVGQLITVAEDLNLTFWDEVKPLVNKIIWVELFLNEPCKELWEEVSIKRKILGDLELEHD